MPVKKMSLVNLAVCEFVTDLLDNKIPSEEVIKAFKEAVDAEPTPENLLAYPFIIPTRLVKAVYPVYVATETSNTFDAKVKATLESIHLNVGALNVDFLMDYFKASKIHADAQGIASLKIEALEKCLTHGPINNDFYEAELYNRLATLYLDDAMANIEKIKELTPKLRSVTQRLKDMPASFLG